MSNSGSHIGGGARVHLKSGANTLLVEDRIQDRAIDNNKKTNADQFTCWYTNETSLNNKFDEFTEDIDRSKAQVIFVCETWWTEMSTTI